MPRTPKAWLVRAGRGSAYADVFLTSGIVGIGWGGGLEPAKLSSRADVVAAYRSAQPNWKAGKVRTVAGQVYRFLREVQIGDTAVTYDGERRLYFMGPVQSEARQTPDLDKISFARDVQWEQQVPRDRLPVSTRNSLGSTLTIFTVRSAVLADLNKNAAAIGSEHEGAEVAPALGDEEEEEQSFRDLYEEMVGKASDFIEDRIARLGDHEMEHLVAGILRAMGYRTQVSPIGPDRGVDIVASPDGLGLEEPRIFVEVKHRQAAMGAQALRAFLGGRQTGDRCLYVSTGGFTKDAKYEADRSSIPITLINLPRLRELLVEHYAELDDETRAMVPLRRLYWPAE